MNQFQLQSKRPRILLLVPPPVWTLLSVLIPFGLHRFAPQTDMIHAVYLPFGVFFIAVGIFLNIKTALLFRKANTQILPLSSSNRILITKDLFQVSRNPIYLGMVLVSLGSAFLIGTLAAFLSVIMLFLILHFGFISFEEQKMEAQFGNAFREYCLRVKKWI